MYTLQGEYRGLILVILMLSTQLDVFGQKGSIASATPVEHELVIIDHQSGKASSMLSMQEEMAMYLRLKKEEDISVVHPNPSKGILWLEHNLKGDVSITLIDETKKTVFDAQGMNVRQIDLRGFPAGKYTLVVHHEGGRQLHPISIK